MKINRHLLRGMGKLDKTWFYSISIDSCGIKLQGDLTREMFKYLVKHNFQSEIDVKYGWINFKKNNIRIILA